MRSNGNSRRHNINKI